MPLALGLLVCFAGCVSGVYARALRFALGSLGRGPARPRPRLRVPARCARSPLPPLGRSAPSFRSRPSLWSGLRSLCSLGRAVLSGRPFAAFRSGQSLRSRPLLQAATGAPPVFLLAPLALASPRGSPLLSQSCYARMLVAFSSSALLAPAGAPRCGLAPLGLAPCVLTRYACALPPRCGGSCPRSSGIPAVCRECGGGGWVVAGFLWFLLGLPPQAPLLGAIAPVRAGALT